MNVTLDQNLCSEGLENDKDVVHAKFGFQGLAFTLRERISLGIHGLQPPRFKTQEEQLALCKASVLKYSEDLNRYLYLVELQVSG